MEGYVIYRTVGKEKKTRRFLSKGQTDYYGDLNYYFRKNDFTVFTSKEMALKFYDKLVSKEFNNFRKNITDVDWYNISHKKKLEKKEKIRKANARLKERIEQKYTIQSVSLSPRILNIEKTK